MPTAQRRVSGNTRDDAGTGLIQRKRLTPRRGLQRLYKRDYALNLNAPARLGAERDAKPIRDTVMAFYRDHIYPHLVHALGNPKPIEEIRQRIIPLAQGEVLEIGVGTGVNFPHYDPTKVTKLYALEPNRGMVRRAEEQRRPEIDVEFVNLPGERIPWATPASTRSSAPSRCAQFQG